MQIEKLDILGGQFAVLVVEDCDRAAEVRPKDSSDRAQVAMPEFVGIFWRDLVRLRQRGRDRLVVRRGRIGENEDMLRRHLRAGEPGLPYAASSSLTAASYERVGGLSLQGESILMPNVARPSCLLENHSSSVRPSLSVVSI